MSKYVYDIYPKNGGIIMSASMCIINYENPVSIYGGHSKNVYCSNIILTLGKNNIVRLLSYWTILLKGNDSSH